MRKNKNDYQGRNQSLRRRIAGAFVLMAFALCTFFSIAAWLAVEVSEDQLVNQRLEKEAVQLIDRHQKKMSGPSVENNFFVNDAIPALYRGLQPGMHEVEIDDREITVIIRKAGNDMYAVTDDTSDFEITELLIFMSIGAGFVASLLFAVVLGLASARRIVAPVTELAEAITRNEAPSALPSLHTQNEIGSLARAFAKRTEQLQQFLSDEKLFTGDVSHELRTPLTIILGAAELLEVQLADSPEKLAVAERVRRVAAEAAERVGALLLLSQSPDALQGSQLSLTHLVEREIERHRQLLGDKPVQIQFESDQDEVWIVARAELVGIAIGNLIRNACQYTEQGEVTVVIEPGRITVEDTGRGLPDAVRQTLGEGARPIPSSGSAGTGLGLSLVKRICEYLGASLVYENRPSGGSRFTIIFPVAFTPS